nr:polyprotein 1 [Nepovirus mori]
MGLLWADVRSSWHLEDEASYLENLRAYFSPEAKRARYLERVSRRRAAYKAAYKKKAKKALKLRALVPLVKQAQAAMRLESLREIRRELEKEVSTGSYVTPPQIQKAFDSLAALVAQRRQKRQMAAAAREREISLMVLALEAGLLVTVPLRGRSMRRSVSPRSTTPIVERKVCGTLRLKEANPNLEWEGICDLPKETLVAAEPLIARAIKIAQQTGIPQYANELLLEVKGDAFLESTREISEALDREERALEISGSNLQGWWSALGDFSSKAASLSGMVSKASRSLATKAVDGAKHCWQSTMDGIVKMAISVFDGVFAKYLENIPLVSNFVSDFWDKVRKWAQDMSSALGTVFEVIHEAALWALCIIVGAAIVSMVESVLVSMGIIAMAGGAVGLFLTLFFSYLGVKAFLGGADKLSQICEVIKGAVCTVMTRKPQSTSNFRDAEVSQNVEGLGPLDTAIRVVSALGSGIVNFKMGTLTYWAKVGSALDQLRKGKDVLKELASWLIEVLGRIYDSVTGKESQFFDELSALVQVDVKHWLTQAQQVLLEAQTMALTDKVLLLSVSRLVEDGNKLLLGVSGIPRKLTMDFFTLINKVQTDLKKIHEQCVKAGRFEGRRHTPFWLYLYGPSHCGKSLLMEQAADVLLTEAGYPLSSNSLYTKAATDAFWSGYRREYCVMLDDLSAICSNGVSLESEMLNIVSSQEYKPNMPFEGEKGMYFDSPIIISSSNVFTAPTSANLLDEAAYNNRRGAVLECRRCVGENGFEVDFDPDNPYASTECRFVDKQSQQPTGPWMNCPAALEVVRGMMATHTMKEHTLQVNYLSRRAGVHPTFDAAQSFLSCLSGEVSMYYPHDLLQACGIESRYFFYAQVDGKLYGYDVNKSAHLVPGDLGEEFEKACLQKLLPTMQQTIAQRCNNGLVAIFLKSLVSGSCSVVSVDKLSDSASAVQREFFARLSLGERVYLRLVQKRMNQFLLDEVTHLPFLTSALKTCIDTMRAGARVVWENSGKILMVCSAILALLVLAQGFVGALSLFAGSASLATGVGVPHSMDIQGASNASSSSYYDSTRGHNNRVNHKHMHLQGGNPTLPCHGASLSLYGPNGFFCPATWARGRSFWITRHQAFAIPDRASMALIMSDGTRVTFLWEASRLHEYAESEICRYFSPAIPPLRESLARKWYLNDYEKHINMTTCDIYGVTVRRTGKSYEEREIQWWKVPGSIVYKQLQIDDAYMGGTYVHYVPKYIHYSAQTQLHDCGAYVCALIAGDWRIIGFHISRKNGQCAATLIPDVIEQDVQGFSFVPKDGVLTDGYLKLGFVEPERAPRMPMKTQYVEVPRHVQLPAALQDCKVPSILSADDERIPQGITYDPYIQGMEKFATPMSELDDEILRRVADDIVEEWHECESFEDVTLDVAINGVDHEELDEDEAEFLDPMVMNTSEGYPFVLERKNQDSGKARYFEGVPGSMQLKQGTTVYAAYAKLCAEIPHSVPELVCIECVKDERLARRKVFEKPKSRLFSILPLHFNLKLREKFLHFSKFIMQNRHRLSSQVGINVHSREWLQLYARLGEKNTRAINCDYERFDGLMTAQVLSVIGNMINRTYKDGKDLGGSERHNLLMALYCRKSIAQGDVFEVRCGIPSGCALTVLLNCIFNEILIRYCFAVLVPAPRKSCFSQYVCLLVYGDDNLIAVAPSVENFFNGNEIKRVLAELNVNITDGICKQSPTIEMRQLEDLNFLKRGFKVTVGDRVRAPLELNSLYSSLIWVASRGEDVFDKLFLNVQVVLRELWHHDDRDLFDKLRGFYVSEVPSWGSKLLTWRQVEDFHHQQLIGMPRITAAQDLDLLIRPEVKAFCTSEGASDMTFSLAPGVKIAGCKFVQKRPEDIIVSFSPRQPCEREDPNVITETVVYGAGVGGLPTRLWGRKFRSEKKWPEFARCLATLRDGGNVYFRDVQPLAGAWIAAIYFADKTNCCDLETGKLLCGNLAGKQGHQICKWFDAELHGDVTWKVRGDPNEFGRTRMMQLGWQTENVGHLPYSWRGAKGKINAALASEEFLPLLAIHSGLNNSGQQEVRIGARCSRRCRGHHHVVHCDGIKEVDTENLLRQCLKSIRTHIC